MAIVVVLAQAGDRQLGPDDSQPARVGAVAAAVMGQLEDRALAHQVGVVFQPPLALGVFAVSGQQHREVAILQPQADRVVVLFLAVFGRLREDRQLDRAQLDLAGVEVGSMTVIPWASTVFKSFK